MQGQFKKLSNQNEHEREINLKYDASTYLEIVFEKQQKQQALGFKINQKNQLFWFCKNNKRYPLNVTVLLKNLQVTAIKLMS